MNAHFSCSTHAGQMTAITQPPLAGCCFGQSTSAREHCNFIITYTRNAKGFPIRALAVCTLTSVSLSFPCFMFVFHLSEHNVYFKSCFTAP